MEARKGQDIIIIVVADGLLMHIHRERPEAIESHLLTEAQGCAHQKESCGQTFSMNSSIFPELPNATQKVGVSKEHCLIGTDI